MNGLLSSACQCITSGLRPCTQAAYEKGFGLFLAFTIYVGLVQPWDDVAVVTFFEYWIVNVLSPASLQNYIAILSHFFSIYGRLLEVLKSRKLLLIIKGCMCEL